MDNWGWDISDKGMHPCMAEQASGWFLVTEGVFLLR